jgi:hypothetical protein
MLGCAVGVDLGRYPDKVSMKDLKSNPALARRAAVAAAAT